MSLFQRAHDIVAAKANKALDAAENPNEMLDLSYEQMLDQITKVRQALVTIAASRKRIELQEQQLQQRTEEEQKMEQTLSALQQRVNNFRTQKETLKAQYTAASAISSVNESVAGISTTLGDSGAALQRA